ncbi:hypothetical protein KUTeg_021767 [Tegillarca granosa]|uniref:Uncharacterized protein n=1 Tax=Tegillarca granosa TaxID=220873 RepID=A0ABQ9E4C0_TEGGR|nr:hypothetical protein KUTeg_021767 [Tegillarca granosa]
MKYVVHKAIFVNFIQKISLRSLFFFYIKKIQIFLSLRFSLTQLTTKALLYIKHIFVIAHAIHKTSCDTSCDTCGQYCVLFSGSSSSRFFLQAFKKPHNRVVFFFNYKNKGDK